jgi:hypothetical protein
MQFIIYQVCNKVNATVKTLCVRKTLFLVFWAEVCWLENTTDCNTRKSVHTLITRTCFLGIRHLLCNPKVYFLVHKSLTQYFIHHAVQSSPIQFTLSHHVPLWCILTLYSHLAVAIISDFLLRASMSHLYDTFISIMDSEFISNNILNEFIFATNHSEVPPANYEAAFCKALCNISLPSYETKHWSVW